MRKNSVDKFYISFPNCHTGNELKLKVSVLYSSLFSIKFSLIFQKKNWWGKTEKSQKIKPEFC